MSPRLPWHWQSGEAWNGVTGTWPMLPAQKTQKKPWKHKQSPLTVCPRNQLSGVGIRVMSGIGHQRAMQTLR